MSAGLFPLNAGGRAAARVDERRPERCPEARVAPSLDLWPEWLAGTSKATAVFWASV
jgi:hypothetical protein